MYELIAGIPPFEAETPIATATKHLTEKPKKLNLYRKDIPRGL